MKKAIIIIILLAVAVSWMFLIYKLSDMNTQNSNGKSMDIIGMFIEDTLEITNEYGITHSTPSEAKIERASNLINAPMRKVMHASVYLVLAFFIILFLNVIFNNNHYWIALILALILCIGFAVLDEYHQTFVGGRTGQVMDVVIDTAGAVAGTMLYTSYYIVYKMGYRKAEIEFEEDDEEEE